MGKNQKTPPDNPHAGHRNRVKDRFLHEGLDNFYDHNILELLLFFSIPQKDTNNIAHELIQRFGSLNGVLDADFHELCEIKGISQNSATLIKMTQATAREYIRSVSKPSILHYTSAHACGAYFCAHYLGQQNESLYALYYNAAGNLIADEKLMDGSISICPITPDAIIVPALRHHAAAVILAHNHPGGIARPSQEDIRLTISLRDALRTVNLTLLDHLVVSGNQFFCILSDHFESE